MCVVHLVVVCFFRLCGFLAVCVVHFLVCVVCFVLRLCRLFAAGICFSQYVWLFVLFVHVLVVYVCTSSIFIVFVLFRRRPCRRRHMVFF